MKRAARVITVFIVSFSVIVCSSFSVFASSLMPLYSSSDFYNKYEDTGTYPTVPKGFSNSISSLNGRSWFSDVTNFDNEDWTLQGALHNVNLGGFSDSDNMLIIRHDDTLLYGFKFSRLLKFGFDSSDNSLWYNWGFDGAMPIEADFFYWTPDTYNNPQIDHILDEEGLGLLYRYDDTEFEIVYCSLPIYNCTDGLDFDFNSVYRNADTKSAVDMTFSVPTVLRYKTYTVTAMLDVNNSYLSSGQQYTYEFDNLGIVFRDDPTVMRMQMIASYFDKDFNAVSVNDEHGYSKTLDLYQNPFRNPNDNYREYNAGEYYDYSFSSAFTYSPDFIEAGVKWIWFRFTIRCDSPVLLFPGTLNVYSYSDYIENQRYEEIKNDISFIINGDTGVPEVNIDTSGLDNTVQEQDAIIQDIYDSLDAQNQDLLNNFGYSSMDEFLQANINDLNDTNMLVAFDFVKMLFEKVVSVSGISTLVLFSLTFGFAMYVLGRRLA